MVYWPTPSGQQFWDVCVRRYAKLLHSVTLYCNEIGISYFSIQVYACKCLTFHFFIFKLLTLSPCSTWLSEEDILFRLLLEHISSPDIIYISWNQVICIPVFEIDNCLKVRFGPLDLHVIFISLFWRLFLKARFLCSESTQNSGLCDCIIVCLLTFYDIQTL